MESTFLASRPYSQVPTSIQRRRHHLQSANFRCTFRAAEIFSGLYRPILSILCLWVMGRSSKKRRNGRTNVPQPLLAEVESSVDAIYDCFFACEETPPVCERQSLAAKARQLAEAVGVETVVQMLQRKTSKFVARLLSVIREEKDDRVSLTLLEDAFDFLEDAVALIESLVDHPAFLHSSKRHFYSSLLLDPRLKSLLNFSSEWPQSMTLDQLLAYIDPSAQLSPEELATAEEISAFREALNRQSCSTEKVRPKVSEQWLQRVAQRLEATQ